MSPTQPLISVITPAYNAAQTLRRAHQSVQRQRTNWEHILVDDGSTDGTDDIIASLLLDIRVRSVSCPRNGPGAAINRGVQMARGEYIALLDADDEYHPDHLEAHLAAMSCGNHVDLFWGGIDLVVAAPEDALVPDVEKGYGFVHAADCVVQGTIFARRHVFESLRLSEDRTIWYQDYEFVERARRTFVVERFWSNTYRYYRGHGASIVDRVKRTWPAS